MLFIQRKEGGFLLPRLLKVEVDLFNDGEEYNKLTTEKADFTIEYPNAHETIREWNIPEVKSVRMIKYKGVVTVTVPFLDLAKSIDFEEVDIAELIEKIGPELKEIEQRMDIKDLILRYAVENQDYQIIFRIKSKKVKEFYLLLKSVTEEIENQRNTMPVFGRSS